MPSLQVHSVEEILVLQERVRFAARRTLEKFAVLSNDPMEALHRLRFEEFGYHPLEDRKLNFIEQLNQTFTILVSLAAARMLLGWFPQAGGLRLNLGITPGRDIESVHEGFVEAEVFAAVRRQNNDKLGKDINKMTKSHAKNCYVFFYIPGFTPGFVKRDGNVEVWALGSKEIM